MDSVWRLIQEPAIRKDAVKMVGSNGTTWGRDITKESEEMQNRGVERGYDELKEMYGEENIFPQ